MKQVEQILSPPPHHFVGDGFRVHNYIPSLLNMTRMDPFLMLDYNSPFEFTPRDTPRGVGVHPHKGFETVTIAYKGRIAHHDSAGGGGIIGQGDVQWMTAGSGVLHKEYHEEEFSKAGGEFQMVQLWVNLPAKDKLTPPKYQSIVNEQMPKIPFEKGSLEIIAGQQDGQTGPASTFSPINIFNLSLESGGSKNISLPEGYRTAMIIIEGEVTINGQSVKAHQFVKMTDSGTDFTVSATTDALVLILNGQPLNEPIAAHGPFVMNTRAELFEAFQEFESGKFGHLD